MAKKSDTIEVRVDPDFKAWLAARAEAEGMSLSAFIRARLSREGIPPTTETSETETPEASDPEAGPPFSENEPSWRRWLHQAALAVLALALIGAGVAIGGHRAALAQAEVRFWFAEMDGNRDGLVTGEEFMTFHRQELAFEAGEVRRMARLPGCAQDAERLVAELQAEAREMAEWLPEEFEEFDRDQDGQLSFREVQAFELSERSQEFFEIDRNSDGALTMAEFERQFMDDADEEMGDGEAFAEIRNVQCRDLLIAMEGEEDPHLRSREMRAEFAALDADLDNRITREEFIAR